MLPLCAQKSETCALFTLRLMPKRAASRVASIILFLSSCLRLDTTHKKKKKGLRGKDKRKGDQKRVKGDEEKGLSDVWCLLKGGGDHMRDDRSLMGWFVPLFL